MSLVNEITLVEQLKDVGQKEKAFRVLVSQYKERLYWHIRKILISHDDTDDVLQNTFIKIFRGIDNFQHDSKLYSWMYRIATNEAFSFLKKQAKHKNLELIELQKELTSNLHSDQWFTGDEIQIILQQAIASLPEKQKLVFNMRYFDDMKYDEISEILNTSVGGLKASYFHAVRKIEDYINHRRD